VAVIQQTVGGYPGLTGEGRERRSRFRRGVPTFLARGSWRTRAAMLDYCPSKQGTLMQQEGGRTSGATVVAALFEVHHG